jgi:hypothetical protein
MDEHQRRNVRRRDHPSRVDPLRVELRGVHQALLDENTVWLKVYNGESLTGELRAYADAARAGLARLQTSK